MTEVGQVPRLRYDEGCLAAHALNVIGDRWALLVVRELMLKPKRFQAIRAGLPGITAGVLTQRLTQLAAAGVLWHDPDLGAYALTDSGRALLPVLMALCHWGARHPGHDPARFISPTALMLSMTANIDRAAAAGWPLVAGMAAGRESFTLRPDDRGALDVVPGLHDGRAFTLTGTGNTLARAVYGRRPLAALAAEGLVAVDGDPAAAQAFADLFTLRQAA
ncbi:MAG TPA: helix-turn-helix domain-containing protein [Amaricoccus sp.]|nr:helix-turn-helix domain-containing protein [Amaricoccus sp.]